MYMRLNVDLTSQCGESTMNGEQRRKRRDRVIPWNNKYCGGIIIFIPYSN